MKNYIDPRHKNAAFDTHAAGAFVTGYADSLAAALKVVDCEALEHAVGAIEDCAAAKGTVYLAGNGGSAAICDHLVCDFVKGTFHAGHPLVQAVSLSENIALYSAAANDRSFEDVFALQLEMRLRPHDLLIAVSSSGDSENILRAVAAARAADIRSIGFSGFDGGRLKEAADIALHLPMHNYGVIEDGHMALLHIIVQMIAIRRDGR